MPSVCIWERNIIQIFNRQVKYCATLLGISAISYPLMLQFSTPAYQNVPKSKLIARHRTADALIRNASSAISDLILVYKKVFNLVGIIQLCFVLCIYPHIPVVF